MKNNPFAQRLEQHCYSHFLSLYRKSKVILIFPSYYKTKVLGAPKKVKDKNGVLKKMTKPQRKKFAVDLALDIFTLRNDFEGVKLLSNKKADDMSDTILHLNAFKYMVYVNKFLW